MLTTRKVTKAYPANSSVWFLWLIAAELTASACSSADGCWLLAGALDTENWLRHEKVFYCNQTQVDILMSPLFDGSLLWGGFPFHRSDFGDLRRFLGGHFGRLGRDRMTLVIPNDRADNKLQFGFILFLRFFFLFFCFLSLAVWFWRVSWSWNPQFWIRKCNLLTILSWVETSISFLWW